MEAVGIGDLHLTDISGYGGLAKYIDNPDQYVMSEVERVVLWAINRQIFIVIFYGDICENPRMSYEGNLAFINLIKKYPNVQFYCMPGNHDMLTKDCKDGHALELIISHSLPNLKVVTKDVTLKIEDAKVRFCIWPSTDTRSSCLNILHSEVKGSKSDSGRLMDADDLSESTDVTVAGHLHTKHRVRNTYYSGTLYQTNFGESVKKYFHHIKFTSPDDYEINCVPFDSKYKLYNIVIENDADIEEKISTKPTDLLKVVVNDGVSLNLPDLPNIVISKSYKTKNELQTILTEDLLDGQELVIRSNDFFNHWLRNRGLPEAVQKSTRKLRRRILHGSK